MQSVIKKKNKDKVKESTNYSRLFFFNYPLLKLWLKKIEDYQPISAQAL